MSVQSSLIDAISLDSFQYSVTSSDSGAFHEMQEKGAIDRQVSFDEHTADQKINVGSPKTSVSGKSGQLYNDTRSFLSGTGTPSDLTLHFEKSFGYVQSSSDSNILFSNSYSVVPTSACSEEMLSRLLEQANATAVEQFLIWKTDIIELYNEPVSQLAQAFKIDLSTLECGQYVFGAEADCQVKVASAASPQCPNRIGTIFSEGKSGKKELLIADGNLGQGNSFSLKFGFKHQINPNVILKLVTDDILVLYDTAKSTFTKVCANPPDLVFPYAADRVFTGEITMDRMFKVNILGKDEVFQIDQYQQNGSTINQIFYKDEVSSVQKIYPYRVVELTAVTENVAIVNFNYAFAYNLKLRGQTKPTTIKHPIFAGANPIYF
ncbi:hypothetical protein HDV01_003482 [Terramyces sp. JEL0728]|nr:hypothetical protein HDV01_003482 [Terramyces sp. JEL0728]